MRCAGAHQGDLERRHELAQDVLGYHASGLSPEWTKGITLSLFDFGNLLFLGFDHPALSVVPLCLSQQRNTWHW